MNRMNVEIFSDVVCPWCYIGKRRFESALARFAQRDQVDVTWRSYQLDPSAPREFQGSATERLAKKMGSLERAVAAQERVTLLAAEEGLTYRMDQAKHGNTYDATA